MWRTFKYSYSHRSSSLNACTPNKFCASGHVFKWSTTNERWHDRSRPGLGDLAHHGQTSDLHQISGRAKGFAPVLAAPCRYVVALRASIADHIPIPKTTATSATSATTATNYASPVLLICKTTATTVISVINVTNVINYASPVLHLATARMLLYILIVSRTKILQAPMCWVAGTNRLWFHIDMRYSKQRKSSHTWHIKWGIKIELATCCAEP